MSAGESNRDCGELHEGQPAVTRVIGAKEIQSEASGTEHQHSSDRERTGRTLLSIQPTKKEEKRERKNRLVEAEIVACAFREIDGERRIRDRAQVIVHREATEARNSPTEARGHHHVVGVVGQLPAIAETKPDEPCEQRTANRPERARTTRTG
jgi:hypothetical protein